MKRAALKNGLKIAGMLATLAVSTASHADKIYFVHNDHLGTPQVITDANKNVVWEVDRDPWGNVTNQITNALLNNVSLPGQFADVETGYSQNWNRDYDAITGRYLQSDPIGLRGGINTYLYVLGNPVMFTDRMGLDLDGTWGSTPPYFPTQDEHNNRNKNNKCPCKEPKNDPNWNNSVGGKYRNGSGYECAYGPGGKLLPDTDHPNPRLSIKPHTEQNYSYNYSPNPYSPGHIYQDVLPSYIWPDNYPDKDRKSVV